MGCLDIGPLFLCWYLGVVPFNTWLISSWEWNTCWANAQNDLHSKWSKLSFWVKIVVILSVAQLVTTVIFCSAWDKSCVKWDNSWNSTQKIRILLFNSLLAVFSWKLKARHSRKDLTFWFPRICSLFAKISI